MPKNRRRTKMQNGVIKHERPRTKLRIGTRKTGKSALHMSSDDLKAVVNNIDMKRYHDKARMVLAKRGIQVDWHKPLLDQSIDSSQDGQFDSA